MRLALETFPRSVRRKRLRQHFNGDVAIQPRVAGAIHLAHAALADGGKDFIGTELVAWLKRHLSDRAKFSRSDRTELLTDPPLRTSAKLRYVKSRLTGNAAAGNACNVAASPYSYDLKPPAARGQTLARVTADDACRRRQKKYESPQSTLVAADGLHASGPSPIER